MFMSIDLRVIAAVREPSLGVPERNGKVHRLACAEKPALISRFGRSRRADSNR